MLVYRYGNCVVAAKVFVVLILFVVANCVFAHAGEAEHKSVVKPEYYFENTTVGVLDQNTFKGKAQIVFFGFMSCPDVCPVTLSNVSRALHKIPNSSSDVRVLFISVDRQRDTLEGLNSYVKSFDPQFVGVTGTSAEIRKAATAFRAPYNVLKKPDGEIEVRHSGFVYLVTRDGALHAKLPFNASIDRVASEIKAVLSTDGASAVDAGM